MARGRPRNFDLDTALDAALDLFWKHGYEGTSLALLKEHLQINAPSLYAAFGSKEELFARVLERYDEVHGIHFRQALAEPNAKRVAESLVKAAITQTTQRNHPKGCLLVQGALPASKEANPACELVRHYRTSAEKAIRKRFERAREDGDLPRNADPAQLAKFIWTVNLGIAVQASGGATRAELDEVARIALRAWPT